MNETIGGPPPLPDPDHSGGPPPPGKEKSWGDRIGVICTLIIMLTIFAFIAGFASDLIVWAWSLGRSIIN